MSVSHKSFIGMTAAILVSALASPLLGMAPSASLPSSLQAPVRSQVAEEEPAGDPSVKELARGVLAALNANSFEALVPYIATAEDVGELWAAAVELGAITAEQVHDATPEIPAIIEARRASLLEDFELIQGGAVSQEISWDEAIVTGIRAIVKDPVDNEEETIMDATTLDAERPIGAEIQLQITLDGTEYELDLGDCTLTSHGWVILERMSWSEVT
jgi:hypothetical protein